MSKHEHSKLESLMKHPLAPLVGGVMWAIAQFTEEPAPRLVPSELPEAVRAEWQAVIAKNQVRFQRRMAFFEKVGEVLMGFSSVTSIIDFIEAKSSK